MLINLGALKTSAIKKCLHVFAPPCALGLSDIGYTDLEDEPGK